MTENQLKKIENLEKMIEKNGEKISKLQAINLILKDQILEIKTPKEAKAPTEEEKKNQSHSDKEKFLERLKIAQQSLPSDSEDTHNF